MPLKTASPRKPKPMNDMKKNESASYITLYDKMALNILRQKLNLPEKNEARISHDAQRLPSLFETPKLGNPNQNKKSKLN